MSLKTSQWYSIATKSRKLKNWNMIKIPVVSRPNRVPKRTKNIFRETILARLSPNFDHPPTGSLSLSKSNWTTRTYEIVKALCMSDTPWGRLSPPNHPPVLIIKVVPPLFKYLWNKVISCFRPFSPGRFLPERIGNGTDWDGFGQNTLGLVAEQEGSAHHSSTTLV